MGAARAPPQSEVGALPGANYSWAKWFPIRHSACTTFEAAKPCGIESDMWTLVTALVWPDASVLELGARYGTTSCVLAQAMGNSGRLVSVEPDPAAHAYLRRNLDGHHCAAAVFRGTIGRRRQALVASPNRTFTYEMRTRVATSSDEPAQLLDHLTVEELENRTGLRFDVWVLDCEGCIDDTLSSVSDRAAISLAYGLRDAS